MYFYLLQKVWAAGMYKSLLNPQKGWQLMSFKLPQRRLYEKQ